ncbi:MAG: hypothetical protein ABI759_30765 [Candidatus Solibacter sp.]
MSPQQLAAGALQQVAHADDELRASALLHAARVLMRFDPPEALRTLEQGLALLPGLGLASPQPLHPRPMAQRLILSTAVNLAAAVAPARAIELLQSAPPNHKHPHLSNEIVGVMINHGYTADVIAYLTSGALPEDYPYMRMESVFPQATAAERVNMLRAALRAWRQAPQPALLHVFPRHWNLLPEDEARTALHELLRFVLAEPDMQFNGTIQNVKFSSIRQHRLFQLLNVMRRLLPEAADSLIAKHPELAAAAARFPNGLDSIMAEVQGQARAAGPARGGGFAMVGNPSHFAAARDMKEAERHGSVEPHFEQARQAYQEDTDPQHPNRAPREWRPSTQAYRHALYTAGKTHGLDAVPMLDRVPDPNLRVLAQIELAAALAGLPELQGPRATFP